MNTSDFKNIYDQTRRLEEVIHPNTVEVLGLTQLENKVLAALLVTGNYKEALSLTGLKEGPYKRTLASLVETGLLKLKDTTIDLYPALQRLQSIEGENNKSQIGTRSLKDQVVRIAKSGKSPAAGIVNVVTFVFGTKPTKQSYALAGKWAKTLGLTRSALFLLEQATNEYQDPLKELTSLAMHQARYYAENSVPDPDETKNQMAKIAWANRMRRYLQMDNPSGEQYERDLVLYNRNGQTLD